MLKEALNRQAVRIIGALVFVNVALWITVICLAKSYPVLLSPAVLAYTFGLRHAVDADHIAAIDNVTRKLMNDGKRPATVGLFFSLGHSTVVILMTVGVVFSSQFVTNHLEGSKAVGGLIGTSVSAFFLFLIGAINLRVLVLTYREYKLQTAREGSEHYLEDTTACTNVAIHPAASTQQVSSTGSPGADVGAGAAATTPLSTSPQGLASMCCPKLFQVIDTPWKMYPLGFLFGLGFDTASEVALLGISALTSSKGIPTGLVIMLPLVFTAGMSLIDTIDGIFMLWAYGWAFVTPSKKFFYNMFLTGTSAAVAFLVGSIEVGGILVEKLELTSGFWVDLHALSENFETLGFVIMGIFATSFGLSLLLFRYYHSDASAQEQCPLLDQRVQETNHHQEGSPYSAASSPVPLATVPFKTDRDPDQEKASVAVMA